MSTVPQHPNPQDHPVPRQAPEQGPNTKRSRMWIWVVWLAAFYTVWLVLSFGFGYWDQIKAHWPIAAAMALGSYVAGSTPMGGGTIGFPVLVLLFDMPASLGRNFGLMIQSIGMTSATLFILCRRIPIERRMLLWSMVGSGLGLLTGTYLVVPYMADATIKLIFACLWMSFGVLTLVKNREFCGLHNLSPIPPFEALFIGLAVGLAGGITASVTGVGIDMMLYTVLVLLYRMDLKEAVPTSVVIMAVTSIMGTGLHLYIGDLGTEVFDNWLAAAPVVILGAPLGAFLVSIISRLITLYFVAVLCVFQFFWTLHQVNPTQNQWIFVAANLVAATVGFVVLYRLGKANYAKSRAAAQVPVVAGLDPPEPAM